MHGRRPGQWLGHTSTLPLVGPESSVHRRAAATRVAIRVHGAPRAGPGPAATARTGDSLQAHMFERMSSRCCHTHACIDPRAPRNLSKLLLKPGAIFSAAVRPARPGEGARPPVRPAPGEARRWKPALPGTEEFWSSACAHRARRRRRRPRCHVRTSVPSAGLGLRIRPSFGLRVAGSVVPPGITWTGRCPMACTQGGLGSLGHGHAHCVGRTPRTPFRSFPRVFSSRRLLRLPPRSATTPQNWSKLRGWSRDDTPTFEKSTRSSLSATFMP